MLRARIQQIFAKRFVWHVSYVYIGALANGVSLFAINVLLGRTLSKEWYGIFTLTTLVLSTVAEMSDFGLNAGLLRFSPFYIATNQVDKLKQLVKTIWQWRVTLSALLTVGGIVLSYPIARYIFGQPELTRHIAFAFLGVGGVILLGFVSTYLQASERFVYNATLQSLKGIIRLIAVVVSILLGVTSITWYVGIYLVVPWILFAVSYHVLPQGFYHVAIEPEVKDKLHSQLKNFSFWLTIASLTSIVASRVDQAMVSNLLGLEQVAVYTVAYQFIQLYPLLWQSISSVLTPKLASVTTKAAAVQLIARTIKWIIPVLIGFAIVIYPSQYLIILLFGHGYAAAMPVYIVLSYGILLNLLAIPFSLVITIFNKTSLTAAAGVLQLVANTALNFIFIPRYGVMGAAYTFACSILLSLTYSVVCTVYLLKKREIVIV